MPPQPCSARTAGKRRFPASGGAKRSPWRRTGRPVAVSMSSESKSTRCPAIDGAFGSGARTGAGVTATGTSAFWQAPPPRRAKLSRTTRSNRCSMLRLSSFEGAGGLRALKPVTTAAAAALQFTLRYRIPHLSEPWYRRQPATALEGRGGRTTLKVRRRCVQFARGRGAGTKTDAAVGRFDMSAFFDNTISQGTPYEPQKLYENGAGRGRPVRRRPRA